MISRELESQPNFSKKSPNLIEFLQKVNFELFHQDSQEIIFYQNFFFLGIFFHNFFSSNYAS